MPGAERLSPASLAVSLALALLLVTILLGILVRQSRRAPSSLAAEAAWAEREVALRSRLRVRPGDDGARLRLAGVLAEAALAEARDSYPGGSAAGGADGREYELHLVGVLRFSPRLVEARQLAEQVARQSRDRHRRGEAWVRLARMHWLLGTIEDGMACVQAAAREDPAYGAMLLDLKHRSRR
jgi:hypothetical protein